MSHIYGTLKHEKKTLEKPRKQVVRPTYTSYKLLAYPCLTPEPPKKESHQQNKQGTAATDSKPGQHGNAAPKGPTRQNRKAAGLTKRLNRRTSLIPNTDSHKSATELPKTLPPHHFPTKAQLGVPTPLIKKACRNMHPTQHPSPRQHLHLLHNLIDSFKKFIIPDFPQNPYGSMPNQP